MNVEDKIRTLWSGLSRRSRLLVVAVFGIAVAVTCFAFRDVLFISTGPAAVVISPEEADAGRTLVVPDSAARRVVVAGRDVGAFFLVISIVCFVISGVLLLYWLLILGTDCEDASEEVLKVIAWVAGGLLFLALHLIY